MKRRLGMMLFLAPLAILIAAAPLENDQKEKEPEGSGKQSFIIPHVHLEVEIIPSSFMPLNTYASNVMNFNICGYAIN